MKEQLNTYCELHWWNMGRKTLSFKGDLSKLLQAQHIKYTKRKTKTEGIYAFHFKSAYGVSFKTSGNLFDFAHFAKQFISLTERLVIARLCDYLQDSQLTQYNPVGYVLDINNGKSEERMIQRQRMVAERRIRLAADCKRRIIFNE